MGEEEKVKRDVGEEEEKWKDESDDEDNEDGVEEGRTLWRSWINQIRRRMMWRRMTRGAVRMWRSMMRGWRRRCI